MGINVNSRAFSRHLKEMTMVIDLVNSNKLLPESLIRFIENSHVPYERNEDVFLDGKETTFYLNGPNPRSSVSVNIIELPTRNSAKVIVG